MKDKLQFIELEYLININENTVVDIIANNCIFIFSFLLYY